MACSSRWPGSKPGRRHRTPGADPRVATDPALPAPLQHGPALVRALSLYPGRYHQPVAADIPCETAQGRRRALLWAIPEHQRGAANDRGDHERGTASHLHPIVPECAQLRQSVPAARPRQVPRTVRWAHDAATITGTRVNEVLDFLDGSDEGLRARLWADLEAGSRATGFREGHRTAQGLARRAALIEEQDRLRIAEQSHNLSWSSFRPTRMRAR